MAIPARRPAFPRMLAVLAALAFGLPRTEAAEGRKGRKPKPPAVPREAPGPAAYPTIPADRDDRIAGSLQSILALPDAPARAAALAGVPEADRPLLPPAAAIERWLEEPRRDPAAAGRRTEIPLPWAAGNPRLIAVLGVPADYDPRTGARPLMIALHGMEDHPLGMFQVMERATRAGCILAAPRTSVAGRPWDHPDEWATIRRVMGHLSNHYRIDPRRIVLCGNSMGALSTWSLVLAHPELYCAAGSFAGTPALSAEQVARLERVPFYFIHGQRDFIPVDGPRRVHAEMTRRGFEHVYVEHPGGHETPVEEREKFCAWLERAPPKPGASPRPALLQFMREASALETGPGAAPAPAPGSPPR